MHSFSTVLLFPNYFLCIRIRLLEFISKNNKNMYVCLWYVYDYACRVFYRRVESGSVHSLWLGGC